MTTLAIDFGSSNTVIAVADEHHAPRLLGLTGLTHTYEDSPPLIPTCLYIQPGKQVLIGQKATQKRADPSRLFRGFKRDLCQQYEAAPSYVDGQAYTAKDKARLFLNTLLQAVLQEHALSPTQVIFTVPVGAYEAYLHQLEDISKELGLGTVRFVDEPTAAALGYGVDRPGSLILVVDLGGGTLDVSLVRIQRPVTAERLYRAEVLAKSDRAYGCGGMDIDTWIAERVLQQHGLSRQQVPTTSFQLLCDITEGLKIRLSHYTQVKESWLNEETFETYQLELDRQQLTNLLEEKGFLSRLRETIDEVVEGAYRKGVSKREINAVLLVGGTSLIPAVQQQIKSLFASERVFCHRPFDAVVYGALSWSRYGGLEDQLRHTYALRLWNPHLQSPEFHPLFKSGTTYPNSVTLLLQANTDGQTQITLTVGELGGAGATEIDYDEMGRLCTRPATEQSGFRVLGAGSVQFPLEPPGKVGQDRLRATFAVNARRQLQVTVKDLRTGRTLLKDQVIARLG